MRSLWGLGWVGGGGSALRAAKKQCALTNTDRGSPRPRAFNSSTLLSATRTLSACVSTPSIRPLAAPWPGWEGGRVGGEGGRTGAFFDEGGKILISEFSVHYRFGTEYTDP